MMLLVCAVAKELAFWTPRSDVEVLVTGVGPVESGLAVARRLARGDVTLVVNAGVAGGFRGHAAVGDHVVVARERYADLGLEGGGTIALPDGVRLIDEAFGDPDLVARLSAAGMSRGDGVTSGAVTTTDARAQRFAETFAPSVESMEGFAVLRAAALAAVPAIEVRGISNLVGDRAASGWDLRAGIRATERALLTLFTTLDNR
jgi:futalosine hydrolase